MIALTHILGAVALILFGARFLRKGLDRLLGARLPEVMRSMTDSRWRAVLTGLGVSLAAPSSTTVSVLAVQAVRSGDLTPRRTLAVMLGANVGFTVMVLLIALRLESLAPALIGIGVLLFQFMRREFIRGVGQVALSLGLIFLAVGMIKAVGRGLEPGGDFAQLLNLLQHRPVWLAVLATILAVALQSSTATIALVIGFGAGGAIGLPQALAVVLGANVGTAMSTLLVGWPHPASRQLGVGNLLAKGSIAIAMLPLLAPLAAGLEALPLGMDHQLALVHTGFNVVVALAFIGLLGPLDRLVQHLAPIPPEAEQKPFGPRYIDRPPPDGFALATGQSMREVLRVADTVREMLHDFWQAMEHANEPAARAVQQRDDEVDLLDERIKSYLSAVASREPDADAEEAAEIRRQLRYLGDLETVGDVIDKNLCELVIKRVHRRLSFSPDGWAELSDLCGKVSENLQIAETVFATREPSLARKLLRHKHRISELERVLRDRHFDRLSLGLRGETPGTSAVYLDLLTHLKRINNHVCHAAYAVIDGHESQRSAAS